MSEKKRNERKKKGRRQPRLTKVMQYFVALPGDADGLFSGSDEDAVETVEMRDGENETK